MFFDGVCFVIKLAQYTVPRLNAQLLIQKLIQLILH